MYTSANDKSKRLEEGPRSALERGGGENGRKEESAYGSKGVKFDESAK